MKYVVIFYLVMMRAGMTQPAVHQEKVDTLEECLGMVASLLVTARDKVIAGEYQAGCQITVPRTEDS